MSIITFGQSDGGLIGVDGVENALVPDLRLGDQRDLGAEIRDSGRHGASDPGECAPGRIGFRWGWNSSKDCGDFP